IHCAAAGTDSKTAMSGMANDRRIYFVPIGQAPLRWAEDTPTAAAGEETDVVRTVRSGAQREAGSAKKTRCRHFRGVLGPGAFRAVSGSLRRWRNRRYAIDATLRQLVVSFPAGVSESRSSQQS